MSLEVLAMGMYTIVLIIPTFMFEIFHNQKNLKPPLKGKKWKSKFRYHQITLVHWWIWNEKHSFRSTEDLEENAGAIPELRP